MGSAMVRPQCWLMVGRALRRALAEGGNEMNVRPGLREESTVAGSLLFLMLANHDLHSITALYIIDIPWSRHPIAGRWPEHFELNMKGRITVRWRAVSAAIRL
jgi:hypothetical protein